MSEGIVAEITLGVYKIDENKGYVVVFSRKRGGRGVQCPRGNLSTMFITTAVSPPDPSRASNYAGEAVKRVLSVALRSPRPLSQVMARCHTV